MASSIKPLVRTYVANGAIPAYSFVKFDTSAPASAKNPRVVSCTSGAADGIAQNQTAAATGDEVEVAFPGGGALLTIGGNVSVSNSLKPTTAGKGIATTSAGDHVGAKAVEGGASGDVIGVNVVSFEKYNGDAT
jgi:hypothetical protein